MPEGIYFLTGKSFQVLLRTPSGLQRCLDNRVGMLVLQLTEPNFYLLDEPTNHVDIPGQERLEAEILAQNATCLPVSHDRSFVNAIGTRFLKIEEGKLVGQTGLG